MSENKSPIPSRLYNAAKGGHVAGTEDIIDDNLGRNQKDINADTYRKNEVYNKEEADLNHERLQGDIDDVDSDLQATKVILNNKVFEIGATVFDIKPTAESPNPVTSDGLHRNVVQADIVIGDPTGDWNPTEAEAAYERFQGNLTLMESIINAKQLEIGAVQTDLIPTEDSPNMLPSGAIYALLQTLAVAGEVVGTID